MKNIQGKTGCDRHETCYRKMYISKDLRVKQDPCYTGITRDAGADSFIPTVCFADL